MILSLYRLAVSSFHFFVQTILATGTPFGMSFMGAVLCASSLCPMMDCRWWKPVRLHITLPQFCCPYMEIMVMIGFDAALRLKVGKIMNDIAVWHQQTTVRSTNPTHPCLGDPLIHNRSLNAHNSVTNWSVWGRVESCCWGVSIFCR